ncbi:hypothetical protein GCM10010371_42850 [Streptomyces subrutilus]|uniref:Uncharacterized protein n=1 Tax=Streptomyces subrutilus TaxID=36818 RepID=A0A918R1E1_9ACTN|nr:hypothetical protein GCM10010371_42850 [Streptomyces subrutilus]
MDQVEPEAPEEELPGEAGLAPVLLAGRLGDLPCLALGHLGLRAAGLYGLYGLWCGHAGTHLAAGVGSFT